MIDAQSNAPDAIPFAWRATMPIGGDGNIALEIGANLTQFPPSDYVPLIGQALIRIGTQLLNADIPEEEPESLEPTDDVS